MSEPRVVLAAGTGPGWLARKMGNRYAEEIEDVRARIWLGFRNVRLGRGLARERFLRSRQAARERLSSLRDFGAYLPARLRHLAR